MAQSNVRIELGLDILGTVVDTSLINGEVDPSAGGGVAADVGSIYMRNASGTDGGEAWLKAGEDNVDWVLFANSGGGAPSGEDTFQNNFMGKTGLGNEYPEYTSTNVVTADSTGTAGDGDNLEEAISALDAAVGADGDLTPLTRAGGGWQVVAAESAKQNLDDIDAAIGADADMTSTNVIATTNTIFTNLSNLDSSVGADGDLTPVTRAGGGWQLVAAESAKQNIDDIDANIGADADMASTNYISTAATIYANLSALDSNLATVASGLLWLEQVKATTADDLSAKSGTGALTDDDGGVYTPQVGDRVASTTNNAIYIVAAGSWTLDTTLSTGETFFTETDLTDTITNEGGAAYTYNGSATVKVADFDFETADSIRLTSGYTPANGTIVNTDTIEEAIEKLDANQADLITLSGVSQGAVDLGTFTGDIIPDNVTIKAALQALETASGSTSELTPVTRAGGGWQVVAAESAKQNLDDIDAVIGADAEMVSTNHISTTQTIYENLSDLDAAVGSGNRQSKTYGC
jgi:hypothetical protein